MCNLYSETKGQAVIRALFHTAHDRTGNLPAFLRDLPRPACSDRAQQPGWRARTYHGALGHAGLAAVRRPARHQRPQRLESALAQLALGAEPVSRARDQLLRVRRHEALQDADLVCTQGGLTFVRFCRTVGEVAGRARAEERAG
jgi:hypothetical protein